LFIYLLGFDQQMMTIIITTKTMTTKMKKA